MCEECRQWFCPPACPNYRGFSPSRGWPIATCSLCEDGIYRDEDYYLWGRQCVCRSCVEAMDIEGLEALCGYSSHTELLLALGATRAHG